MKIICTVEEFAAIVRGCAAAIAAGCCSRCALSDVCHDRIECFVQAENIIEPKEDAHAAD